MNLVVVTIVFERKQVATHDKTQAISSTLGNYTIFIADL
jgi:hypothetical protein